MSAKGSERKRLPVAAKTAFETAAACGTAADRLQLAITATAIQERRLRGDGLTRGLVTLCIGGGQGIALAIKALH